MSDTPLITGPAASLLHSRLSLNLTSLNSILQELDLMCLHLYAASDGQFSLYLTSNDGRRWGGYRVGITNAFQPESPIEPTPLVEEPSHELGQPESENPTPQI